MDDTLAEAPVTEPQSWAEGRSTSSLYEQLVSPSSLNMEGVSKELLKASAIQWFGVDIGGTLVKCVYFETQEEKEELQGKEREGISALRTFLKSNLKYGSTGVRDSRLEMPMLKIGGQSGTLHFIKFATCRMDGFFDMVTKNGLGKFAKVVCATGGGAFKFETDFKEKLGINLCKYDEMACLIRGVHYLCIHCPQECYYWKNPKVKDKAEKVPFQLGPNPYPYIIVNIGSGISVLLVESAEKFKRIGGTSVGGGTFVGLSSLLAGTQSFEEAIALAEKGDSTRVDKLVRDIYGGGYEKFGLGGDVVACSFGHMVNPERHKDARPEDLAKASLVTVTNNIGAIARMCASISGVERVIFVGNYLCGNELSVQMLAYAMEFWSQGTIRALFLEHEGYFGALGSMLFRLDPDVQQ